MHTSEEIRQFTPEEINLAKEIAKIERKEIRFDDLVRIERSGNIRLTCDFHIEKEGTLVLHDTDDPQDYGWYPKEEWIPLWTISGALEWLRDRAFYVERLGQEDEMLWQLELFEFDDMGIVKGLYQEHQGKTPLEALLKPVLKIMREGKK